MATHLFNGPVHFVAKLNESQARQARAEHVLSKLKNSCPRQPLRQFSPTTLVKVWRKMLPHEAHKG